ncbi:hypothetical protein [Trichothermofontia sp.]
MTRSHYVFSRASQPPPLSRRGRPATDHTLLSLLTQLRTHYAQQAIDCRSYHLSRHHLQIQLHSLSPSKLSLLTAPRIGQQLAQFLQQQRATLLARQIRQIDILITDRQTLQLLWQTKITLTSLASSPPANHAMPPPQPRHSSSQANGLCWVVSTA